MADHTDTTRATGTSPGPTPGSTDGATTGAGVSTAERGARDAKAQAHGMKEDAKAKARETKEKAKSKAREVKEDAKERVREVRDEAERKADRWTSAAGERTSSMARALRAAADSLRDEGEPGMADLAGRAAEQVERMGGYLEDENPSAMLHDLEDMGRRNPGTFVGSTFAMGLLLGRFLRSSSPRAGDGSAPDGDGDANLPARDPEDLPQTHRYRSPRGGPSYGGAPGQATGPGSVGARPGADAGAGEPGTRSTESAREGDYPAGESRPSSPSAPASAGEVLGSGGTVDPTGGPDIRPSSEAKERGRERGTGETPVPSPSGGASAGDATTGQGVRTGSAGAASAGAGSGPSHGTGRDTPSAGTTRGTGSSRPGGNPQSSGTPTSGTGAPTGDHKEKEDRHER